jgi:phenylacetate-CoA ligase
MRRLFSDFVRRKNTFQTHILDPKALLGGSTEMPDFFDRNDTRPAKSREASLFRNLKTIVAIAKPRASGLRRLLRDCETPTIAQRADLARLPVMRKRDMERMRAEDPPFGGEKGDVILNCFSYHLAADGHIIEDGALALGCAVIPAGTARIERKLEAIHALTPNAFCGEPEHLKQLLDQARDLNRDVSSLRKALVFGQHLSPHVRADIEARGIGIHQAFVTADLGVIAYETDLPDGSLNEGMIVSEGLILEIVKPGTNEPARAGEVGEVVVTRVIPDFPLLRMSTGDLSRIIPGPSPCGRTSPRIAGWLGRVDETTRVGDLTLTPSQVLDLGARHACVRRLQLVVSAEDATTLKAEGPAEDVDLPANLKRNMLAISGVDCKIEIVAPGVLTDKSRLVVDERR